MRDGAAFRGQPLLLLAVLLVGWTALRVALWQPPFEASGSTLRTVEAAGGTAEEVSRQEHGAAPPSVNQVQLSVPALLDPLVPLPLGPVQSFDSLELDGPSAAAVMAPGAEASPRAVIGHSLLFMAGLSQIQVPQALLAYLQDARPVALGIPAAAPMLAAAPPQRTQEPSRWSADGWVLLRNDSSQHLSGPTLSGRPSYGRSQAGAVIRYRLASESALQPQAYVRASAALAGAREREVAAGLSARPLAGLPLRLAVEARLSETDRGTRLRPAAFAVTEFPPVRLPLGVRGEVYAQGGYVGGEFATPFVDGQARAERPLARRGETELSAGAGVWGGAQKGAARLDIGPTAAVSFRLGPKSFGARGRVAADYRFRVAGQAQPSSGPALTLSAGF
jgi:hypothetical protein